VHISPRFSASSIAYKKTPFSFSSSLSLFSSSFPRELEEKREEKRRKEKKREEKRERERKKSGCGCLRLFSQNLLG